MRDALSEQAILLYISVLSVLPGFSSFCPGSDPSIRKGLQKKSLSKEFYRTESLIRACVQLLGFLFIDS